LHDQFHIILTGSMDSITSPISKTVGTQDTCKGSIKPVSKVALKMN